MSTKSNIPDPGGGQSAFAAALSAHYELIGTPRPDGVVMPPTRPRRSVPQRIGARLRREEREWEQFYERLRFLQDNPIPEVRHHA